MASFSSNAFHKLSHITDHKEWRRQASEMFRSSTWYENYLQNCDFHGTQPNIDCQTYFDNSPFKFVVGSNIKEAPVVLPPWKKAPRQLGTILQYLGCSAAIVRVPKVDCEGAQHLMCVANAQRMVEMNEGGSVVFGVPWLVTGYGCVHVVQHYKGKMYRTTFLIFFLHVYFFQPPIRCQGCAFFFLFF